MSERICLVDNFSLILTVILLTVSVFIGVSTSKIQTLNIENRYQPPKMTDPEEALSLSLTPMDLIKEAGMDTSVNPDHVCKSVIFAFSSKMTVELILNMRTITDFESPYVIQGLFNSDQDDRNINFDFENSSETHQNYSNKELTVPDLLKPSRFESFRFIPQCFIILLENLRLQTTRVTNSTRTATTTSFSSMLESMLEKKLAKSYRDYFVFFSEKDKLEGFFKSKTSSYVAYKYGVYKEDEPPSKTNSEEESRTGTSTQFSVIDFCGQNNAFESSSSKNLKLFTQNCQANLNGKTIVATAVAGDQFVRFENYPDGSLKKGGGIYYLMFRDCSKRMNFTLRMYPTSGSGSKTKVEDGQGRIRSQWSGALGELIEERADIAFPVSIIEQRDVVIDYTCLVAWFEKIFWVKAPPLQTTAQAITKPFTLSTWKMTVLSMIACIPVFYCFLKNNNRDDYFNGIKSQSSVETTLQLIGKVIDMIIRLLLEQSTALRSCTGSRIRFTIFVWAVFSLIMGTGYRSKLFFFLTFLESAAVPRTHHELAYSDYKLYFRTYGGVAYRYITQSKDPIHKAMLMNNRLKLESTTVGCIQKVFLEENAACMDYDFSGDYTIFKNATLFAEANPKGSKLFKRSVDVDGRFMIIWAFKKGSPLRRIFNHAVMWMMASGMYDRWVYEDWTASKIQGIRWIKQSNSVMRHKIEQIEKDLEGGPKPLGIQTLIVPFMVLVSLCGMGLIVFLWEFGNQLISC